MADPWDDPWDDPRARAWAHDVETRMVPAMRDSHLVAPLYTGKVDAKLAVELGAAVWLDKPIVVVVQHGVRVPDKVVRVADHIVEGDVTTEAGCASLAGRITEILNDLDTGGAARG